MNCTRDYLTALIQAANVDLLRRLGITSGEISYNKASASFGKWFRDQVARGRLKEVRRGNGASGTRVFAMTDILTLQAEDYAAANINI